jgi:peptidoglycan/LPS O-acetylase OafA/YrhL
MYGGKQMNTEEKVLADRIRYIDFLKFIGLTAIIVAHVGSPNWLMAIRSFDVPFMVILSAILGERSFRKFENNPTGPWRYCISRVKRLVFPTWIFLVIYFGVYFVLTGKFFDWKYYLSSFALTRYGIGYVWVILVYLYSALLIPLYSKIKLSKYGMFGIAVIYILYELAYYFQIGVDNKFLDTTFYYLVPYGVLTYLGYNYRHIEKKQKGIIVVAALAIFVGLGIYYWLKCGNPQLVQIAKYPPRLYYLGYGVAVSFLLLLICENWDLKIYGNAVIRFVSKNSMWIYLWHILVLTAYGFLKLPKVWYVKLPIVYIGAVSVVLLVNKILDVIEKKKTITVFKYLRG